LAKIFNGQISDENIHLTKLSLFKLDDSINDITKSKTANATILNNNYMLLETNNEEQSKLLDICKVPISITPHF